LTVFH